MTSNNSNLTVLTSSQENMILTEVMELELRDIACNFEEFFDPDEQPEAKYDISQLSTPTPQEHHHQGALMSEHYMQVQMPTNEEFTGDLNFELLPDQQDDSRSWVYSQLLKKVFIEMGKTLPVRVKCSPLRSGLFIRALMAYCQPAHRSEPVTRCHNHIALSDQRSPFLRHVLSCKNANAVYGTPNGFYSVVVPLGIPQAGSDSVQMDFMFHCKNSCNTGINRRLTEVVFNLENEVGQILGRQKLLVRICSCPKRDRDKEEKPYREQAGSKKRKLNPGKKLLPPVYRPPPSVEQDNEIFTFTAKIFGRDNYEYLRRSAYGLMLEAMDRTGQHGIIKPLLEDLKQMR